MTSNRNTDDAFAFTIPSSSSSPFTASNSHDSFLSDTPSLSGSASGSFLNEEGLLSNTISDAEFGFSRPDFRVSRLAGTVYFYQRHVFLCYKNPQVWSPKIDATEFDRMPWPLSAAVMATKADMSKETRLAICEGHDGTETSNGDVLMFCKHDQIQEIGPF